MIRRFDTRTISKQEILAQLLVLDAKAGTSARTTHFEGEEMVVTWPPSSRSVTLDEKPSPSLQNVPAREQKGRGMFPKLQGAAAALDKLHHGLEDRADKFLTRVAGVDSKGAAVFDKAHAKLDVGEASLGEVDKMLEALDQAGNGAPNA